MKNWLFLVIGLCLSTATLYADSSDESEWNANEGTPFSVGCDDYHACPYFIIGGGVSCTATNPTSGDSVTLHGGNGCLGELRIAQKLCSEGKNPRDYLLSCQAVK